MKNKLRVDLSKARFTNFNELFDELEACFNEFDIDFYVIGALARDMIFSTQEINTRTTADIDLAVFINSNEEIYPLLQEKLKNEYNYSKSKTNNFSLISPKGITIDLLPFGAIEVDDGVVVGGEGLSNIKVNGFKEVQKKGLQIVETEEKKVFKLASLSSIVLLKIIAFDRPEVRADDPGDVASVIANFFDIHSELIYENHNDLFEGDETKLEMISAQVIGREIKIILNQNEELEKRVLSILDDYVQQGSKSKFLIKMVGVFCDELDLAQAWMKKMLKGVKE